MADRSAWRFHRPRLPRRRRALVITSATALVVCSVGAVSIVTAATGTAAGPASAVVPNAAVATSHSLVAPVLVGDTQMPSVPAHAVTVSPAPGSQTADPKTQISFLGRPISELGTITVTGSESGVHTGRLLAYSTGTGASFVPDKPFVPGEVVTVTTSLPIDGSNNGTFSFTVAHTLPLVGPITHPAVRTTVPKVDHFASSPNIAPPVVQVSTNKLTTGADFFLAPKGSTGQDGPMIVAPNGQLVWFHPLHGETEAFDLNEQRYEGKPVLTWFQGIVKDGHGQGVGIIANTHYQTVAVVHGGNGVQVDLHEFQLTPQGTALVTAYRTMRWNTSADGGTTNGTVFDGVFQEIDVKTGLVMYEWDSLDHVPVSASDFRAPKGPNAEFDYFHINALQQLSDGTFLVSSRNTSAAYEIDPAADGAVLLTLGGKNPSVTMGSGSTFWFEHDVELRAGDNFTIFDDGALPAKEPASRALTLHLDPKTGKVSVVSAFSQPGVLAAALGNVQLIAGGDEVVGWGTAPSYSVLGPHGSVLYQASLPTGDDSYRAYLHTWVGRPNTSPSAAVLSGGRVAMSWNGETGITRWRVLTGPRPGHLHIATTVPDSGYQTLAAPSGLSNDVRVQALGASGAVLGTSAIVKA